MRKVAMLALALSVGACASGSEMMDTPPRDVSATLQPTGQGDSIRAAFRAQTAGNTTAAVISIAGGRSGASYPWHIHEGPCPGGAIVGEASAYPALSVSGAGTANATAYLNVPLMSGQQYHVNVHQSASQLGTVIACGEFR